MKSYSVKTMKTQKCFLCVLVVALMFSLPSMAQSSATGSSDWFSTKGAKVYQNETKEFTKSEVRTMLANTKFLNLYNQGVQKNRSGNTWLIASCGLLVATATYTAMATTSGYTTNGTYTIAGMSWGDKLGVGLCAGATVGTALIGLAKKGEGIALIGNAVDGYNNARKTTSMELNLGVTGNSVALMLKF